MIVTTNLKRHLLPLVPKSLQSKEVWKTALTHMTESVLARYSPAQLTLYKHQNDPVHEQSSPDFEKKR